MCLASQNGNFRRDILPGVFFPLCGHYAKWDLDCKSGIRNTPTWNEQVLEFYGWPWTKLKSIFGRNLQKDVWKV